MGKMGGLTERYFAFDHDRLEVSYTAVMVYPSVIERQQNDDSIFLSSFF